VKTKAIVIVPCTHRLDGTAELQLTGPRLCTTHWSVHRREENGSLSWETDARNERAAHEIAAGLAKAYAVTVEPYAWAPSPMLTACEFALRSRFGIDLFDAGIKSEQDLHERGYASLDMVAAFAKEVGNQYGLERIDI
jgi:hypothetical protein